MSYQEGYLIAKNCGLESQYMACIADDLSPEEALVECNIV